MKTECNGCGKPLEVANAWMEDGCPCNTRAGVNDDNLHRWRLLHQLQQQQSTESQRRIEALTEALQSALHSLTEGDETMWRHPESPYHHLHVALSPHPSKG